VTASIEEETGMPATDPFLLPELGHATPWSGLESAPVRPDEFSFVLLSDRTGMARPGVFERAVEITNLLRPDFAIQLGDTIEGYTRDADELARQWKEFDGIAGALEVPLFRVPGNHDVGNEAMRDEWLARHGALHYHFRYRDVLFLVLDTQDPPQSLTQMLRPGGGGTGDLPAALTELLATGDQLDEQELIEAVQRLLGQDPTALQALMKAVKDGTQPAHLADEQLDQLAGAIAEHDDVRWTVLLMHMPLWQGDGHPALDRLRTALGARPYTAFAGHTHNYRHSALHGRDHIRLGSTGGIRMAATPEGDFDHVSWVTMTASGPVVANLILDGVLGIEGGRAEVGARA
jgi:3',5'-cyclic AMP phosphodiesterase CpdA